MVNKISKEQNIADIITTFPETAEYFADIGIHCVGCMFANAESLEQGLSSHGLSTTEIEQFVKDLNEIADSLQEKED